MRRKLSNDVSRVIPLSSNVGDAIRSATAMPELELKDSLAILRETSVSRRGPMRRTLHTLSRRVLIDDKNHGILKTSPELRDARASVSTSKRYGANGCEY